MGLLQVWMSSPFLHWGLGTYLAAFLGYSLTTLLCEWAIRQAWAKRYLIVYSSSEDREALLRKTRGLVPFGVQLRASLLAVGGAPALGGAFAASLAYPYLIAAPKSLSPSLGQFAAQFVALALVADLGLYWGHRVQHMVPFLWDNYHSLHHKLRTPSSASTAYIHERDALLQATLPVLVAALVVQCHPLVFMPYVFFHISNNAWNHSGLDGWWVRLLSGKFLPLRCDNRLHDSHHRFGQGASAKNYGECFWLWDYVFGTLSKAPVVSKASDEQN